MRAIKVSLRNGDESEFKALFDTYSKRLYNIACRHVPPTDAQDIVQDLFIEIWEKRDAIEVRTSWDGYLYSILKYRIYRFLDRRNELDQSLTQVMNEIGSPDDIMSFEQLYCKLDKTVNSLPPQCRTIFEKKYYQNKKLQEISDEMNISIETVKTQLKRGLKTMRLQLRDAIANFIFL